MMMLLSKQWAVAARLHRRPHGTGMGTRRPRVPLLEKALV